VTANDDEQLTDGWAPDRYQLARPAAVGNLTNALEARDLDPAAARALARAAVRPDDMRRKLADPVELRVQGGTLLLVETRLWSASVLAHPANPREYGHRTYALGGTGNAGDVLLEPDSMPDGRPELLLGVDSPVNLVTRLADAEARLVRSNPLVDDLRVEGVLQPLTVVALTVEHADETAPVTFLIAADGSSRISSVHEILGYSSADLVYTFAADDRRFRTSISSLARLSQGSAWENLSDSERARLRVLTVPARVVVGFRSDSRTDLRFHTAIRNFIGLTHIRPPKAYGRSVEAEAKADAVLDALVQPLRTRPALLTSRRKQWFAATATSDAVARWGLPQHPDIRAADIVRAILAGGLTTSLRVNNGIRSLTGQQKPKREDRVDIAVELILRPLRGRQEDALSFVRSRRAVLQRAYRLPEISDLPAERQLEGMPGSALTLKELRNHALEEVADGFGNSGRLAPAQTELAVKAAYYMAVAEPMALQREIFGGEGKDDDRSPAVVMRAMLSGRRGVLQSYAVVEAGRNGQPLLRTDDDGRIVQVGGDSHVLTDPWIRQTYNGEVQREVDVGLQAANRSWAVIDTTVSNLKRAVDAMNSIPTHEGGVSIVSRDGWDSKVVREVRYRLDFLDRQLGTWGDRFDALAAEDSFDTQP
jgi:hypothetical protein